MRVKLSAMPDALTEYITDFPRLDGGLNLAEEECRLDKSESPEMKNLWWKDGVLRSRRGQRYLSETPLGQGFSALDRPWHGAVFFHAGDSLYTAPFPLHGLGSVTPALLLSGVPENRGSWFVFGDSLYYKNRGGYYAVSHDGTGFAAAPVAPYTPVILINAHPSGAGDEYQPENRLSPKKTVWYTAVEGEAVYQLPVGDIDSVDAVTVDGAEAEYTADLTAGTVTFATPPPQHDPVRANTVVITYSKANPTAYASVMDCPHAAVYGGGSSLAVVVGGGDSQPNAYYWSGSHTAADGGYFPMEQYNLAGDSREAITGFGRQQGLLVIFKEGSLGKGTLSTVELANGRASLTLDYTAINSSLGCDVPPSIRLVGNNLVFAHSRRGVYLLGDTSAAGENNVRHLSRKVDAGLLPHLQGADAAAWDDGERYYLAAGGWVYLWDHGLSAAKDPVWFRFDAIPAAAFFGEGEVMCHVDGEGRLTVLDDGLRDYGGAIHRLYRFAPRNMGSFDKRKDIRRVLFSVQGSNDCVMDITYLTDWERRRDAVPIRTYRWRLAPRNLAYRYLDTGRFSAVAVRKPGCRRVRHFSMMLENNTPGVDMAVVAAQVVYRFSAREG